jgi:peptide/nickel transport system permease protein
MPWTLSRPPAGIIALAALYVLAALAPALAPYDPDEQHRTMSLVPPTPLHFVDGERGWPVRPFVLVDPPSEGSGERNLRPPPVATVHFWIARTNDGPNGVPDTHTRIFGVHPPAHLFLLGTDRYGRDQFSRLLAGARVSLGAGLLAASLSMILGLLLGGIAGLAGGWTDRVLMRGVELFLAVPWLYLLLAVRAALPLDMAPSRAFFVLVGVIGVAGWARPARLVRGMVLSGRERGYVEAARVCGASEWYVLWRHILPQTLAIVVTQATLLAPQFALAEMTLSFFGLGLSEPLASWGNLLADLTRDHLLEPSWYAAAPVAAVVAVFIVHQWAADAVTERTVQVGS